MSPHPEELLSALLDGELTVEEAQAVAEHVAGCAACAAELDAVRDARRALRSLPGLPPPVSLFRPGAAAPSRWASGSAAAALVGAVLVVGVLGGRPAAAVSPDTGTAVDRHAAAVELVGHGGAGRLSAFHDVPAMGALHARPDLPGPLFAPESLAGYELVGAFSTPGGIQLVYERGPFGLSVFATEGRLQRAGLPEACTKVGSAWRWDHPAAAGRVMVAQRGDLVVTVVGDESAGAVVDAIGSFPSSRRADLGTRLRRGWNRALDALTPFG